MSGRCRLYWSSNTGDPWEQVSKVGSWLQAHSELWRRQGGADHLFWCALPERRPHLPNFLDSAAPALLMVTSGSPIKGLKCCCRRHALTTRQHGVEASVRTCSGYSVAKLLNVFSQVHQGQRRLRA